MGKKIITLGLCIFWMGVIFYNSSQSSDISNIKSKNIANKIESKNESAIKDEGVKNSSDNVASDKGNNKKEINKKVENTYKSKLNITIRKIAHLFEFLVLAILVLITLITFNIKGRDIWIYTLFIVLLYALSDEYHQLFVTDRTSSVIDVIIDFIGGIIGVVIYYIISSIYMKLFSKNRYKGFFNSKTNNN